jgi:hypothetical protein
MCLGKRQNRWQKKQSPLAKICDGPMFHLGTTGNGGDCYYYYYYYYYYCQCSAIPLRAVTKATGYGQNGYSSSYAVS